MLGLKLGKGGPGGSIYLILAKWHHAVWQILFNIGLGYGLAPYVCQSIACNNADLDL